MSDRESRTPARLGEPRSNLARADLLRRLKQIPIPPESVPRVLRFLEDELEQALAARADDTFSKSEIEQVSEDAELVSKLRGRREEKERVEAIRLAGLAKLSSEELEGVLADAKRRR